MFNYLASSASLKPCPAFVCCVTQASAPYSGASKTAYAPSVWLHSVHQHLACGQTCELHGRRYVAIYGLACMVKKVVLTS